jgi:Holliday junction DNA helicase RuvA
VIAHLSGTVARTEANSVVLDVNGVGYRAFVPLSVLASLPGEGAKVTLHTSMVVREDDITLYGFRTEDELHVFTSLTSVTGVGPKVALSMLSVLEGPELARAIASGDVKVLTRVPGVGPKLAQRVVLELGDKMARFAFDRRVHEIERGGAPLDGAVFEDIVEALVNLQYNRTDARKAAESVLAASAGSNDVPKLIRGALNLLSGAGKR